jgi:hypothetical protein
LSDIFRETLFKDIFGCIFLKKRIFEVNLSVFFSIFFWGGDKKIFRIKKWKKKKKVAVAQWLGGSVISSGSGSGSGCQWLQWQWQWLAVAVAVACSGNSSGSGLQWQWQWLGGSYVFQSGPKAQRRALEAACRLSNANRSKSVPFQHCFNSKKSAKISGKSVFLSAKSGFFHRKNNQYFMSVVKKKKKKFKKICPVAYFFFFFFFVFPPRFSSILPLFSPISPPKPPFFLDNYPPKKTTNSANPAKRPRISAPVLKSTLESIFPPALMRNACGNVSAGNRSRARGAPSISTTSANGGHRWMRRAEAPRG